MAPDREVQRGIDAGRPVYVLPQNKI